MSSQRSTTDQLLGPSFALTEWKGLTHQQLRKLASDNAVRFFGEP